MASPALRTFLANLAAGRGAVGAPMTAQSGYREIGVLQIPDMSRNAGSVGGDDHVACD